MEQPINNIKWVDRNLLIPNDYNPNHMYQQEFELLCTSILDDGWIFPIVIYGDLNKDSEFRIIDGYHRYKASGTKEIQKRDAGKVPVVALNNKSYPEYMARTVRLNRAKGVHSVEGMSKIVLQMLKDGWDTELIMQEMGMEQEEVKRLAIQEGIPASKLFSGEFSESWVPAGDDE